MFPVGRPGRIAIEGAARLGQIEYIAFLGGYVEEFAASLKHDPLAAGSGRGVADAVAHFFSAGHFDRKIADHVHGKGAIILARRVHQIQYAADFEHEASATRRQKGNVEVGEVGHLGNGLGAGIVRPDI